MASRLPGRLLTLALAAGHRTSTLGRRRKPARPRRILVANHLLLGDTIMLGPLLAKLRSQFPTADVVMTAPRAYAPLFATRPWGVEARVFDPRSPTSLRALAQGGTFDLALVPGDNRFSWTAAAAGARWIVAFAGDRPAYKSLPVDESRPWPVQPMALGDLFATLVDGPAPPTFSAEHWPAPPCTPFAKPTGAYAVLHLGASSPLKLWPAERWRVLATELATRGLHVVLSCGPREQDLVSEVDPDGRWTHIAGSLDLPQMWALLANARLLVTPDTGIAHLAKVTLTPTVTLVGPGSDTLVGPGEFWRDAPWHPVTQTPFPCRDQHVLFKRSLPWVVRCGRSPRECASPRCMLALDTFKVLAACDAMLASAEENVR